MKLDKFIELLSKGNKDSDVSVEVLGILDYLPDELVCDPDGIHGELLIEREETIELLVRIKRIIGRSTAK